MFEHIVGHESVTTQLENSIRTQSLPHAILIGGPIATGKCTIALEIARVLNCNAAQTADCVCVSCQTMRRLAHPGVVLIGPRYGAVELRRAYEAVQTHAQEKQMCEFAIFSFRKILKRIEPTFLCLTNATRRRKLLTGMEQLEEKIVDLEVLLPAHATEYKKIIALCKEIATELEELLPLFPTHISVDTVRAVRAWMYQSISATVRISKKIVIIEQSEFLASNAANALLKVVEETPEHAMIIFLATDPNALLPTLQSRVRRFSLSRRSVEEQQDVIRTVFGYHDIHETLLLPAFLQSSSPLYSKIQAVAQRLIEAIEQPQFSSFYHINGEVDAIMRDKRFGQEELRLLIALVKDCMMKRWQAHEYGYAYTQFLDYAFTILHRFQQNIDVFHFKEQELFLPMLIELKKGYAAIH